MRNFEFKSNESPYYKFLRECFKRGEIESEKPYPSTFCHINPTSKKMPINMGWSLSIEKRIKKNDKKD